MVDVIGQYVRFRLPRHWGSGRAAIADGTHVKLCENNLLGSRHIRYGGYGGIAYHHIADTYIALFTTFITCGVWEAVHILDALLKNRSEIQPDTVHEVRPRLKGESTLARFADDAIMAFDNIVDAKRVLAVLGKRLARFGLTLHPDKTRLVDFRPQMTEGARHPETDGTSFDFLGLTHVWGRSRNGKNMVRQVTAKSRFARAVAAVSDWCRKHRHWSIRDQHRHLSSMMRGHFAYYGVGGNIRRLRWFAHQVVRIWQKWLSRRDRQSVVRWARLNEILKRHPLPPAKIFHGYAAASESLS